MIDASRAVLSAATRLCVTSRTAAVIRIPSSVSIADSEISAGNVLPSRRRPARSIPAPIGRGLGLAAYLSRWAGCTPKRDHVGGTCAGEAPASALAASALAASVLAGDIIRKLAVGESHAVFVKDSPSAIIRPVAPEGGACQRRTPENVVIEAPATEGRSILGDLGIGESHVLSIEDRAAVCGTVADEGSAYDGQVFLIVVLDGPAEPGAVADESIAHHHDVTAHVMDGAAEDIALRPATPRSAVTEAQAANRHFAGVHGQDAERLGARRRTALKGGPIALDGQALVDGGQRHRQHVSAKRRKDHGLPGCRTRDVGGQGRGITRHECDAGLGHRHLSAAPAGGHCREDCDSQAYGFQYSRAHYPAPPYAHRPHVISPRGTRLAPKLEPSAGCGPQEYDRATHKDKAGPHPAAQDNHITR